MGGRAVLITGGTSGIGLATAELLHEQGTRVMVTGRNPQTLDAARDRLPAAVAVVAADAASLEDARRVADLARERFGTLTGVFLNAGLSRRRPIGAVGEGDWDELFATNTRGQFFALQQALPLVGDGGAIVFTLGTGISQGLAGASVTAGSRGALRGIMRSLAVELAPRIRVNAVSPGAIDTPIWTKNGVPEQARAALATTIPFGRFGRPREVAQVVAFLLSDAAGYVTGQDVAVAGGL